MLIKKKIYQPIILTIPEDTSLFSVLNSDFIPIDMLKNYFDALFVKIFPDIYLRNLRYHSKT